MWPFRRPLQPESWVTEGEGVIRIKAKPAWGSYGAECPLLIDRPLIALSINPLSPILITQFCLPEMNLFLKP